MPKYQIDATDQKILSFLVNNARMPFLEIARECGVSGAAIHQRVKKMENLGIITGSRLLVKPQSIGLNVCAFVAISIAQANRYQEVIDAIKKIPEVVECHFTTGPYTMLVKLYARDNEQLMSLLNDQLQGIPGVVATETLISLEQSIKREIPVHVD